MSEEHSSSSSGSQQKKWTAEDDHAATMAKWWPRMLRTSNSCSWDQFCRLLHELLSSRREGFDSSNEISRLLFLKTLISAQMVALQSGFLNWEQMLHSEQLEHVVIVEDVSTTSNWKDYRYRAALWRRNYSQPRTFPYKLDPIWLDKLQIRSEPLVKLLEERKRAETASTSGERKTRLKVGELISYEVSDEEDEEEGKEAEKGANFPEEEDEEGEGWRTDQQEGDGKECSSGGVLLLIADDKQPKSRKAKGDDENEKDVAEVQQKKGKGQAEKTVMDEGSGSGSDRK